MANISTTKLAKKLHVSNSNILQHFSKMNKSIKKHSFTKQRTRYYDKTATSAIISSYKNYNYHKNKRNNDKLSIKLMESTIKKQDESIKKLEKFLNHQQLLTLGTQKEVENLQNQLSNTKNQLEYHKHNFLWKLFH